MDLKWPISVQTNHNAGGTIYVYHNMLWRLAQAEGPYIVECTAHKISRHTDNFQSATLWCIEPNNFCPSCKQIARN